MEFYKLLAIFAYDVLYRRDDIKLIVSKKGNPFGPHFNKFLDSVYSYIVSPPHIGLRQFLQRTEIGKLRHDAPIERIELSKHMRKFAKGVLGVGIYVVEDIRKLKLKNAFDAVFLYTWMDLFLVWGRADPLRDSLDKIVGVYESVFAPLVSATKKFLIVFESTDSGLRATFAKRAVAAMHELKLKEVELDIDRIHRIQGEYDVYTNIVRYLIPLLGIKLAPKLWHSTEDGRAQWCVYKKD